jgi:hypothetical protein
VREGEFGDRLLDMIAGGGASCKASLSHGWLLRISKLMKEHQEELMVNLFAYFMSYFFMLSSVRKNWVVLADSLYLDSY